MYLSPEAYCIVPLIGCPFEKIPSNLFELGNVNLPCPCGFAFSHYP
jgi:hypothetical protein